MRILLDENLNWRLKRGLTGHEVEAVPLLGWSGIKNGALLRKAADHGFQVLLTMDSNMVYQQNLPVQSVALIVLKASSNRLEDTLPLMSKVLKALPNVVMGTVIAVE